MMAALDAIPDDEILLRHIPGGTAWQAPGPRITSGNFRVRHDVGETGVSVTRKSCTTAERLLELVGADPASGSRVAEAAAGAVRALGLDVVPVPLADDPGHSEIRSATASLDDHIVRKRLAQLFHFLP